MRTTFAPVFEKYGVDAVYNGHSHNYERSWYLHGHHGMSTTFDAARHAELNDAGQPALGQNDEKYAQISSGSGVDDKVVYAVAGSAGKADDQNPCPEGQTMGCTLEDWLLHPAMRTFEEGKPVYRRHGIALRGSVVVDAGKDSFTSRFIDENGQVLDWFTITRQ
jgi:acid phosphatase type 7